MIGCDFDIVHEKKNTILGFKPKWYIELFIIRSLTLLNERSSNIYLLIAMSLNGGLPISVLCLSSISIRVNVPPHSASSTQFEVETPVLDQQVYWFYHAD